MRKKVVLACGVCKARNYTTGKNPALNPERVEIKKFCKECNEHTLHLETK